MSGWWWLHFSRFTTETMQEWSSANFLLVKCPSCCDLAFLWCVKIRINFSRLQAYGRSVGAISWMVFDNFCWEFFLICTSQVLRHTIIKLSLLGLISTKNAARRSSNSGMFPNLSMALGRLSKLSVGKQINLQRPYILICNITFLLIESLLWNKFFLFWTVISKS